MPIVLYFIWTPIYLLQMHDKLQIRRLVTAYVRGPWDHPQTWRFARNQNSVFILMVYYTERTEIKMSKEKRPMRRCPGETRHKPPGTLSQWSHVDVLNFPIWNVWRRMWSAINQKVHLSLSECMSSCLNDLSYSDSSSPGDKQVLTVSHIVSINDLILLVHLAQGLRN